ncbi:MAG TPA: DUF4159 domain-containing protein [Longimicrobiales bacterium]
MRRTLCLALALAAAFADAATARAQGPEYRRFRREERVDWDNLPPNAPYDGRFNFVRIRFEQEGRRGGWGWGWRRRPLWGHDYPRAGRNFTQILDEITTIHPLVGPGTILTLDDPELFKYPVAYLCEPGGWVPSDAEVEGLRNYLLKGGFIIFDDFSGRDWFNFVAQMRRVLPDARLIPLDTSHPIFHAFFKIESLDFNGMGYRGRNPQYYGIFEDNDPDKRLMVVVNYDNDIGEYWEYSATGFMPIDLTNEAYKLGVNYVMYALTH